MIKLVFAYFLYFISYSIIGWIYEVFLEVVVYGWGFSNRGVLFGPYCPVYGFGALAFLFFVYPLLKNKKMKEKLLMIPIIFFLCMFIATLIELVTSYLLEAIIGSWPWQTYADYKYNFEARIALSPSIRFGLGGCAFLYLIQPLLEKLTTKLGNKKTKIISIILFVLIITDLVFTIISKIG